MEEVVRDPEGSGSHATHEAQEGLRPSGFDPSRDTHLLQGPLGEAIMREWRDFEIGEPRVAWAAVAERFREEARLNQRCADSLRKDAADALEQADGHQRLADDFTMLANAIARAPVAFPA